AFSVADMAAQPWVLPPQNISLRAWVEALFEEAGMAALPAFVYTDASPAAFAQLVRSTRALTVMTADSLASPLGSGLVALPLPAPTWSLQIGLFWRRSAYFSAPMAEFRAQVGQAFAQRSVRMAAPPV